MLSGTRIWTYDPEDFKEEECEGEEVEDSTGHGQNGHHGEHGHEGHGHGEHETDDDHGETEMFYHLITFK